MESQMNKVRQNGIEIDCIVLTTFIDEYIKKCFDTFYLYLKFQFLN